MIFGSNWHGSTGLDNDLVLTRWQAIIWSNGDKLYWSIYATLGLNDLMLHWFISKACMPCYQHSVIPDVILYFKDMAFLQKPKKICVQTSMKN